MQTLEEKIDHLTRQVQELGELVLRHAMPEQKFCLGVEELARRWDVHAELIRRLVRDRKLKAMRGLGKHRFTIDEIRRFETHDDAAERQKAILARHGR